MPVAGNSQHGITVFIQPAVCKYKLYIFFFWSQLKSTSELSSAPQVILSRRGGLHSITLPCIVSPARYCLYRSGTASSSRFCKILPYLLNRPGEQTFKLNSAGFSDHSVFTHISALSIMISLLTSDIQYQRQNRDFFLMIQD